MNRDYKLVKKSYLIRERDRQREGEKKNLKKKMYKLLNQRGIKK